MTRTLHAVAVAMALALIPAAAFAEDATHDMSAMPGMAAPSAADAASTKAFKAADETMMHDMAIDYTGNADIDFVRGMIPHHAGAIAMAKVELAHGKDPEIRKLAEDIIAAQEKEIAFMQDWLKRHPAAPAK